MKKSLVFTLLVVCHVGLALFAGSPDALGAKDTLIIGKKDDTVSLDPAKSYEASSWGMLHQVLYETLVTFKEGDFTQVVPILAESWDIGKDGRTWTFHLRKGVNFASGNPVNADTVVFSLRRAIKIAGSPSWPLTQFGLTEGSITKVDDDTVQIILGQQYAPGLFLACLSSPVASILDPNVVMAHEQNGDVGSAWLEDHSAGSGPFILTQRRPGEGYVFDANERYWGRKPAFRQIMVKVIQDTVAQMALLEKGELDLAWNLPPEQIQTLTSKPDVQVFETLSFALYVLGMNQGYEPLRKSEVRNAIRYALDYDGLINYVLGGAARKIQTIVPQGLLGYNPATPYSQDIAKAKQLLAAAGYPNGFEVELDCVNFSPWSDLAMKVKTDLAQIGIQVKLVQQSPELASEALMSRRTQLWLWEWNSDYPDPDANAKAWAHADSSGENATIKGLAWFFQYVNLETSKLVEQAAEELDAAKRAALYQQITDIILKDGPYAILCTPLKQYAVRAEVVDWIGTPRFSAYDFPIIK